jgi:hypothetical protein
MRLTLECKVAVAEWSNMDNAQLRDVLEKGQILFQEEFAQVIVIECRERAMLKPRPPWRAASRPKYLSRRVRFDCNWSTGGGRPALRRHQRQSCN